MIIRDLGQNVGYADAWELQKRVVAQRKARETGDTLLLLEHRHVITLGRNGKREHLLASSPEVEIHETNRGGDVTYHGPGQLVGYPILDLAAIRKDVVWYVRSLEQVLIDALAEFGIEGGRKPGMTGAWVSQAGRAPEKIAAIGVHISRWVTSHGFALNVNPDLRYFEMIVPCGIREYGVTSMERVLGRVPAMHDVKRAVAQAMERTFVPAANAATVHGRCEDGAKRQTASDADQHPAPRARAY